MIIEHADLTIVAGREEEFVQAFPAARDIISAADGFHWLELLRGVEHPSTFLLLVGWESLEAHLQGFRESERFVQWRGVIGEFLAGPTNVTHLASTAEFSRRF
jgi:heme-degrading monooxygenase HmoA